ncbi:hypothetical protein [Bradyrhizobium sp.]|uniref:hypothetical protein n=1 Tax=Bradyrhizobium sp. TaxID=376 RepID=UPI003C648FCF
MAFPGVCAIATIGMTVETVKAVNAMAAKVENVVREKKRRMLGTFLNDRAPVYPNAPR